jgi:hypothetical protein
VRGACVSCMPCAVRCARGVAVPVSVAVCSVHDVMCSWVVGGRVGRAAGLPRAGHQ